MLANKTQGTAEFISTIVQVQQSRFSSSSSAVVETNTRLKSEQKRERERSDIDHKRHRSKLRQQRANITKPTVEFASVKMLNTNLAQFW